MDMAHPEDMALLYQGEVHCREFFRVQRHLNLEWRKTSSRTRRFLISFLFIPGSLSHEGVANVFENGIKSYLRFR